MVCLLCCLFGETSCQSGRRTAPRRTTKAGGTYGTETFAPVTEPATTPAPAVVPGAAALPSPFAVAAPVGLPIAVAPGLPLLIAANPIVTVTQSSALIARRTFAAAPAPVGAQSDVNTKDDVGDGNDKANKINAVSLCEEVEELLKPGSTQEECFVGEPVTLRYWQPYRALRTIKCKNAAM